MHSQFARVVKGVDLRSTAGNCAWAQTPQLTAAPSMIRRIRLPGLVFRVPRFSGSPSPPLLEQRELFAGGLESPLNLGILGILGISSVFEVCIHVSVGNLGFLLRCLRNLPFKEELLV